MSTLSAWESSGAEEIAGQSRKIGAVLAALREAGVELTAEGIRLISK